MPARICLNRILELLLALILIASIVQGAVPIEGQNLSAGQKLILNVYLDKTGKALVTGYVQDISDLPFLNASQYRYENDTLQLYALTDALTRKDGDLWNLKFESWGTYDDYHVTFYLPSDLMLKRINVTQGLEYLLSASNQSLVADVQGYEVQDPRVFFEYQQPLQEAGGQGQSPYLSLGVAALLVMGLALIWFARRREKPLNSSRPVQAREIPKTSRKLAGEALPEDSGLERAEGLVQSASLESAENENGLVEIVEIESAEDVQPQKAIKSVEGIKSAGEVAPAETIKSLAEIKTAEEVKSIEEARPAERAKSAEEVESVEGEATPSKGISTKKVEVSSEMAAVMETLTARERAILQALIEAGGRMTQADLRYETRTPKSSLSGILLSLERRKIVIKKEWGRTNVIELSEWFLSKKERS